MSRWTGGKADAGSGAAAVSLALAAVALVLGLPQAEPVLATVMPPAAPVSTPVTFTPANVDPALARRVAARIAARGASMRFTPAGLTGTAERAATVAVRVDGEVARAIQVRGAIAAARGTPIATVPDIAITPMRYNLGIARGYQSFAKAAPSAAAAGLDIRRIEMPDLAQFRPREGAKAAPGRLQPRLALEQARRADASPVSLAGGGEQAVDLAAGYRLSRNLNVSAGVRLSRERDRLAPLTGSETDNQAVYVGTQFRF